MSQTVITTAFEALKAQQAASNTPVILDGFVFANVPGLNIADPIDPAEAMPGAAQIVHRADVAKTGVVNENAVVYSVTLGADIGDFEFNWVGLINKASNTLAMIVHAPAQQKVKNAAGKQGNVLTRSFLMEYDGAKKETQITTPAQTWQIDFTARLAGMDERVRVENIDVYGAAAFLGNGFLVTKSGNNYAVTAGVGYVGGLRGNLAVSKALTVAAKPMKVWADVSWTGTLTSVWQTAVDIQLNAALVDYVKDGTSHYVCAIAQINADGTVTDLRPKGPLSQQQASSDYLRKDKNLAEVEDKAAARGNIGLKGAAVLDVGATAGTVAAGNDTRIANALQKGSNLSELTDKSAARNNLGLKGAAVLDVGTAAGTVAAGNDPRILNAVPNSGGSIDGQLIINSDASGLTLKTKSAKYSCYIFCKYYDNTNYWYVGAGSNDKTDVAFNNYKGGNNSISLLGDGAVLITATNDKDVKITGQVIPTKYDNFDAKYQPKGSYTPAGEAYTKAQSDTAYAAKTSVYTKTESDGRYIFADSASYAGFVSNDATNPYFRHKSTNAIINLATRSYTYSKAEADTRFQPKGSYTPSGEAYTKAESNGRYVTQVRLGSVTSAGQIGNSNLNYGNGIVLTGIYGSANYTINLTIYYRAIQYLINGVWYTATSA